LELYSHAILIITSSFRLILVKRTASLESEQLFLHGGHSPLRMIAIGFVESHKMAVSAVRSVHKKIG